MRKPYFADCPSPIAGFTLEIMQCSIFFKENTLRAVLYLAAALLGLNFWSLQIHDPDLGWQLTGGAWILEHRAVPTFDFINTFNASWLDYHWLAQAALYTIYKFGGYGALRIVFGLIMAYLFIVILDIIIISIGRFRSIVLPLLLLILASIFIAQISSVRPQMIAVCLIAVTLRRLLQKPTNSELMFLTLISALMVNMHVYWVLVPFLWGCYRVIPAFMRKRKVKKSYAIIGFLTLSLCGLISPYGYQNYIIQWEYLALPQYLKDSIREFRGSLAVQGQIPIILLIYIIVMARLFRWRRFASDAGSTCAALVTLFLSLRSIKFVALFALAGQPLIARHGIRALRKHVSLMARREILFGGAALYPVVLIGSWFVISGFPLWPQNRYEEHINKNFPIAACQALAKSAIPPSSSRSHIRVATHFNDGGWCRWAMHESNPAADVRVTTDGRTQFVPVDLYKRSFELYGLKPGWDETLKDWAPDAIVVGKSFPLSQMLGRLSEWRELYQDEHFLVFLPNLSKT